MALTTPNMGLTAWDLPGDSYDHLQLANNFVALDEHDHTPGKGVRLGTNSLLDGSITTAKLANNSVSTIKIQDGAVTGDKMDKAYVHPLGVIWPWWRPNELTAIPAGWAVPVGQTLVNNGSTVLEHDFPGGGTIVLPDLRNRFILGAATSGTGTGVGSPPGIGQTGGANTTSLAHSHTVNDHVHSIPGHSHTVNAHAHSVSDHEHTVSSDGAHAHTWAGGLKVYSRRNGFITGHTNAENGFHALIFQDHHGTLYAADRQTLYIGGFNSDDNPPAQNNALANMDNAGSHSHGGKTGGVTSAVYTGSDSPGTSSVNLNTNNPSSTVTTQDALTGNVDIRPQYIGLLYLMKVKY